MEHIHTTQWHLIWNHKNITLPLGKIRLILVYIRQIRIYTATSIKWNKLYFIQMSVRVQFECCSYYVLLLLLSISIEYARYRCPYSSIQHQCRCRKYLHAYTLHNHRCDVWIYIYENEKWKMCATTIKTK